MRVTDCPTITAELAETKEVLWVVSVLRGSRISHFCHDLRHATAVVRRTTFLVRSGGMGGIK
jgi:hypothetical protein